MISFPTHTRIRNPARQQTALQRYMEGVHPATSIQARLRGPEKHDQTIRVINTAHSAFCPDGTYTSSITKDPTAMGPRNLNVEGVLINWLQLIQR